MNRIMESGEHDAPYQAVFGEVSKIIDSARESAVRSVNAAMTAAYWLVGHRIVEFEQSGEERAEYGAALIERLAADLTRRFGRGFSRQNVQNMRTFYLSYPPDRIRQTLSGKLALPPSQQIRQTPSGKSETVPVEVGFDDLLAAFPLPWSAYVRLLSVSNESARDFYETEALRGGWSGPTARPADRLPVLRANRSLKEQSGHADQRTKGAPRRPRTTTRRTDQRPLRPRIPRPQGRGIQRATLRRRSSATWRPSSWNWETTSASWEGRGGCASAASGTGWTCCSFTEA